MGVSCAAHLASRCYLIFNIFNCLIAVKVCYIIITYLDWRQQHQQACLLHSPCTCCTCVPIWLVLACQVWPAAGPRIIRAGPSWGVTAGSPGRVVPPSQPSQLLILGKCRAIQNQFQVTLSLTIWILSKKNGCEIKPTSIFVNLQMKTLMTGNDGLTISSTFWSIS